MARVTLRAVLDLIKAVLTFRLLGFWAGMALVLLAIWSLAHGAVVTGVAVLAVVLSVLALFIVALRSRGRQP